MGWGRGWCWLRLAKSPEVIGSSCEEFVMADSGLVVVLCVISLLLVTVFIPLLRVEYTWCHVLFDNTSVGSQCRQQSLNIFF